MPRLLIDMTGQVIGRLTVISYLGPEHQYRWLCRCECGRSVTVGGGDLRCGAMRSCGCLKSEVTARRNHKHGLLKEHASEYRAWVGMRGRCNNSAKADYQFYGGRGIAVCDRWSEFPNFFEDMGPKPGPRYSIDRIDNEGHYEPGNCRWATHTEQMRNRRTCRYVQYQGERMTAAEAAERAGLPKKLVHNRLKRGWTDAEALSPAKPPFGGTGPARFARRETAEIILNEARRKP